MLSCIPSSATSGAEPEKKAGAASAKTDAQAEIPKTAWPSFRNGPQLHGVASSPLPDELELLWKRPATDGVVNAPAIVGERVYVGTLGGMLLCLNRRTGEEIWKHRSIDDPDPKSFAPGFKSAPTVTTDAVYVGDEDGVLHSVHPVTGKLNWKFKTGGEIVSSASLAGDKVIFGSYDNSLYCVKAKDGTLVWNFPTDGYVNCTPAIAGKYTFVTGCDEHLRVIDIETGKEHSNMPLNSYLIASPALMDGTLYFGTYSSEVIAVDWQKQEVLWRYKDPLRELPFHASAALTDKLVVVGGRDKQMHCIDRQTGAKVWVYPTRGRIDSSAVVAGDRVFFGSSDRNIYGLSLKDGKELWKYNTGKDVTASPAVGEGVLVIGTEGSDGEILCFGKKVEG